MAHKISWFVTERGKRFTFSLVCATSIGICSAYTLPHTFLLDKYKEIVQLYKSGIPVKLPQNIKERFNIAMELLEIPEVNRERIKPFTVFGFDVFNAGTIYSKFGGYVGIPINFSYSDVSKIDKNEIKVENESVNWSTSEGKQLLDSLVLSEKAQLFAIAREISTINSLKLLLDTTYATSTLILMYGIGNHVNRKFNLYARPSGLRGALYSMIAFFGFGMYAFFTDYTQNHFDMQIDKELCAKNKIFIEGGKEFYEKQVLRNMALRKLMGAYGERKYSVLGNENYFIRQKHLPLVVRRDFFINKSENTM